MINIMLTKVGAAFSSKPISKTRMFLACFAIFMTVNGCDGWVLDVSQSIPTGPRKSLTVLTVNRPLSFQNHGDFSQGYEHDLLSEFALERGYSLRFKALEDEWAVVKAMSRGEGDIAAARIPSHYAIRGSVELGPAYDEQHLSLVCRKDLAVKLTLTGDLAEGNRLKIATLRKNMGSLARAQFLKKYPHVELDDFLNVSTGQLLRTIGRRYYDCAILDRWESRIYLRFHTSLKEVTSLGQGLPYHFLVKSNNKLNNELSFWFQKAARRGQLGRIRYRYAGYLEELNVHDRTRFFKALGEDFKSYRYLFRKYAKEFNVPWQLIAAVAYQESHWQNDAESPTGVEGLMQLTKETANFLGVEDRRDPEQSIWGGAKYLRFLLDYMPARLTYRAKLGLALAAYNSGVAHLKDAQILAKEQGKDPLAWKDLRTVYPLLSDPDVYSKLEYGAARGEESVDFVDRVFNYYDLLSISI